MSIILDGSPASEGIGAGRVFVLDWGVPVVPHGTIDEQQAPGEVERFQDGIKCFEQALSNKRAEPLGGKEADMAKEQIRRFRKLHKEQGKKLKRLAKATG